MTQYNTVYECHFLKWLTKGISLFPQHSILLRCTCKVRGMWPNNSTGGIKRKATTVVYGLNVPHLFIIFYIRNFFFYFFIFCKVIQGELYFDGENKTQSAKTFFYENYLLACIKKKSHDRLLLLHRGDKHQPTRVLPSVRQSAMSICLLVGWPWLGGAKLFQTGQRLTDLVRLVSEGSDQEAEDSVSVLSKVQFCVSYWHLQLLEVPQGPLLSV